MASKVTICNMAVSHVGADAVITSIDPPDGSQEAGHCARFYDQARTELLEPGSWTFSKKRATLATVTNDSDVWLYAYAKPSDALRLLRIPHEAAIFTFNEIDDVAIVQTDEGIGAAFEVEGDVIYTDEPEAKIFYISDVTDTTKFSPSFITALSYRLAAYIAGPVVKGSEGIKLAQGLREIATNIIAASATADANQSQENTGYLASQLAARR